jgi:hypothetical protein
LSPRFSAMYLRIRLQIFNVRSGPTLSLCIRCNVSNLQSGNYMEGKDVG